MAIQTEPVRTPALPPDIAALVPLLAAVRARKIARLRWGSEQDRAEDVAPTQSTAQGPLKEIAEMPKPTASKGAQGALHLPRARKSRARRKTRVWTPSERAAALALLARNGGRTKATAREFRTADGAQVSESTLRSWRDNPAEQPPAELVETAALSYDQLPQIVKGTLMKLAVGMRRDEWVQRQLSAKTTSAVISFGVLSDKLALLLGKPTGINVERVAYTSPDALRVLSGGPADESPALPAAGEPRLSLPATVEPLVPEGVEASAPPEPPSAELTDRQPFGPARPS